MGVMSASYLRVKVKVSIVCLDVLFVLFFSPYNCLLLGLLSFIPFHWVIFLCPSLIICSFSFLTFYFI